MLWTSNETTKDGHVVVDLCIVSVCEYVKWTRWTRLVLTVPWFKTLGPAFYVNKQHMLVIMGRWCILPWLQNVTKTDVTSSGSNDSNTGRKGVPPCRQWFINSVGTKRWCVKIVSPEERNDLNALLPPLSPPPPPPPPPPHHPPPSGGEGRGTPFSCEVLLSSISTSNTIEDGLVKKGCLFQR